MVNIRSYNLIGASHVIANFTSAVKRACVSIRARINPQVRNRSLNACALENIHKVWGNDEVKASFSDEFVSRIADEMLTEVVNVCSSRTPFAVIRTKLANAVNELADFQVLVLEPPPAHDETGLRGAEVTGMLKENIRTLSQVKNHLKLWDRYGSIHSTHSTSPKELLQLLDARYRIAKAKSELFLSLDSYLDGNPNRTPDWYKPFVLSMCAHHEHFYRSDIGMPSVLDHDAVRAKIVASEHRLFYNLVKNGVENPYEAWQAIVAHIESEHVNDQLATYHMYLTQYPH